MSLKDLIVLSTRTRLGEEVTRPSRTVARFVYRISISQFHSNVDGYPSLKYIHLIRAFYFFKFSGPGLPFICLYSIHHEWHRFL